MSIDTLDTKQQRIFFSMVISMIWMASPVLSVLVILYTIFKLSPREVNHGYLCFLIALTFGIIAYTAEYMDRGGESTDITRYTAQFKTYSEVRSVGELFLTAVLMDGGIYVVFQLLTFFLSKLFPANPQVLPFFWVTISYFFLLLTVLELTRRDLYLYSKKILLVLILLLLFGTTLFTMEVELLKQSSATAVAAYALVRKLNHKKAGGWFFALAFFLHTSVILFLPIFILFDKKIVKRYRLPIFLISLLLSCIDINSLLAILLGGVFAEKANFYASIENWQINKINYTLFIFYGILIAYSYLGMVKRTNVLKREDSCFNICFLSFCLLLIQMHTVHNFVRFSYLYSPFYVIAFYLLLITRKQSREKTVVVTLLFSFSLLVNSAYLLATLNSAYTNAYMNNSLLELVSANVYSFLNHRVVN
ncbi:EpsG family protein [Chitinophaga flava]|uniref:EpsG family protein n=1 Tax=Chitinophaga flava TaxID=2259036 RepID=A0A365Y7C6_9BACT|nr:EpsG family protein [Chitinophaga flava]RBL93805.1 hypothetical protein DF182_15020 [Chitinophaga flava]